MPFTDKLKSVEKVGSNYIVTTTLYGNKDNLEHEVTYTLPASYVDKYGLSEIMQGEESPGGSPATIVVAPRGSGLKADYYTTGTNDQTVINNIINAYTANGGATILLKRGTYTINNQIIIKSNIRLIGEGRGQTILNGVGTNFNIINGRNLSTEPTDDFEIAHLTIDGSGVNYDLVAGGAYAYIFCKGIGITYIHRGHIHDVHVRNTQATGIGTDFLVDSVIENCLIENTGQAFYADTGRVGCNGIGIGNGAYDEESLVVSNCHIRTVGNSGILFEQQNNTTISKYMKVTNCFIEGALNGIRNSGVRNVTITNCETIANRASGIDIDSSPISGSMNPTETIVMGCTSVGNTDHGININIGWTTNGTAKNYKISNCFIHDNGKIGIRAVHAQQVSITDCDIYSNGQDGIKGFASTVESPLKGWTIRGNKIYNNGTSAANTYDGISLLQQTAGQLAYITIAENSVWDDQGTKTQRHGLYLQSYSSSGIVDNSITIANNHFVNNAAAQFNCFPTTKMYFAGNYTGRTANVTASTYSILPPTYTAQCSASSNAITVTLPDATLYQGNHPITVIKVDSSANTVTIQGTSGQTINGAATRVLSTQWDKVVLTPTTGNNWMVV